MHSLPRESEYFVNKLKQMQQALQQRLCDVLRQQGDDRLYDVVADGGDGDTQFRMDKIAEDVIMPFCESWSDELPFLLIAEGLSGDGRCVFPHGSDARKAAFVVIADPVDGTRLLMYDKRSAWSLAGIAPNRGIETSLADIVISVQTELPTTKQTYADTLWAVAGGGAFAERRNLLDGSVRAFRPRGCSEENLDYGFCSISNFFPDGKGWLSLLEERMYNELGGSDGRGNPLVFCDQYLSSGGQLYELAVGHDRFVADLRPLAFQRLGFTSRPLCAHPYDLCTWLIASEAGVQITGMEGKGLTDQLDVTRDVGWIGYGNAAIRDKVEPALMQLLYGTGLADNIRGGKRAGSSG
ncbi:MAG: FIG domain-containing protein [Armatimonadota bacterium]